MDSKKTLKTKANKKSKTKKTPTAGKGAKVQAAKAPAPAAAKNFLFSVPSLHTANSDYEHLIIAPNKEEACRLLAEHRVTEKKPDLEGTERTLLVNAMRSGYSHRDVSQIEARKEPAGVLAINHHKLGVESMSVH